jgi:hypothetical protein
VPGYGTMRRINEALEVAPSEIAEIAAALERTGRCGSGRSHLIRATASKRRHGGTGSAAPAAMATTRHTVMAAARCPAADRHCQRSAAGIALSGYG